MRNEFDDHRRNEQRGGGQPSDDLRERFWGEATESNNRGASKDDTPMSGAMRAVRDSWSAFKPRPTDGTGALPRTRQHGMIDPTSSTPRDRASFTPPSGRKRVARHDLSIADLASGRTPSADPAWDDLDDWSDLDALTARHEAIRASRVHRAQFGAPVDDHTPQAARRPRLPQGYANGEFAVRDDFDEFVAADTSAHQIPLTTQLAERIGWRGADPLLVRGVLAVVLTLALAPILWLRGGDAPNSDASAPIEAPSLVTAVADQTVAPETSAATTTSTVVTAESSDSAEGSTAASPSAATSDQTSTSQSNSTSSNSNSSSSTSTKKESTSAAPAANSNSSNQGVTSTTSSSSSGNSSGSASASEPAERTKPDCSNKYTAVEGDSWWGIADRADVSIDSLLSQNNATSSTVILPGNKICLPSGADDPSVATTTTTKAPKTSTTDAPNTTTTAPAPTTTKAPSGGSPGRNATPEQVKQVIRDVFPDELEAKALDIAYRESRYIPTADNNFCCHGIFQIYWTVHRSWLKDLGINSVEDLYDPVLNAKAALELYRRAGNSWSPWTTA